MLLTEEVEIVINVKHIKYYENLGYTIPRYEDRRGRISVKRGTKIIVKIEDLQKGSTQKIKVLCDHCKENISEKSYFDYLAEMQRNDNINICDKCRIKNIPKKFEEKYGVASPAQLDWVKEKMMQTTMNKFGVKYAMQSDIIKVKSQMTNLQKYGFK